MCEKPQREQRGRKQIIFLLESTNLGHPGSSGTWSFIFLTKQSPSPTIDMCICSTGFGCSPLRFERMMNVTSHPRNAFGGAG